MNRFRVAWRWPGTGPAYPRPRASKGSRAGYKKAGTSCRTAGHRRNRDSLARRSDCSSNPAVSKRLSRDAAGRKAASPTPPAVWATPGPRVIHHAFFAFGIGQAFPRQRMGGPCGPVACRAGRRRPSRPARPGSRFVRCWSRRTSGQSGHPSARETPQVPARWRFRQQLIGKGMVVVGPYQVQAERLYEVLPYLGRIHSGPPG